MKYFKLLKEFELQDVKEQITRASVVYDYNLEMFDSHNPYVKLERAVRKNGSSVVPDSELIYDALSCVVNTPEKRAVCAIFMRRNKGVLHADTYFAFETLLSSTICTVLDYVGEVSQRCIEYELATKPGQVDHFTTFRWKSGITNQEASELLREVLDRTMPASKLAAIRLWEKS